jgi:dihydroorotate dehydrogenase electron transfer subunit
MIHHLQCEVLESKPLSGGHHWLVLHAPRLAAQARPGQFLYCAPGYPHESTPLLRRPLSIAGLKKNAATGLPENIELAFRLVGPGTRLLAQRKPKEMLDCLGPLGNSFTTVDNSVPLLLAGGIGIAPLRWLALHLAEKGTETYLLAVAKSIETFPFSVVQEGNCLKLSEFEALGVHTEFASEENGLLVTDLLSEYLPRILSKGRRLQVYAVGPRAMIKALVKLLPEEVVCQVSLEERMACGVGACRSCVVAMHNPTRTGYLYRRVCKDGPVFDLRDIIWEMEREDD